MNSPEEPEEPASAAGGDKRQLLRVWLPLLALSVLLVVLMQLVALPASLLLGPMLAAIAIVFSGRRITMPRLPFNLAQGVLGCLIAQTMTWPVLQEIAVDWMIFVAGVLSVVFASIAIGWMLARYQVLPGTTAIWGAFPGAASVMTLMSASFGADMRLVAFMQYTRVVIVTIVAATFARFYTGGAAETALPVYWFAEPQWGPLGQTLALILVGVFFGRWLKLPAGPMLSTVIAGSVLNVTGLIAIELPQILLAIAYATLGWGIGARFDRAVIVDAGRAMPRVIASILALVAICGLLAALLVWLTGIDPLSAYLATSPGGADSIAVISASTDVDVAFVMSMQIARFFFVMALGPILAKFVAARSRF